MACVYASGRDRTRAGPQDGGGMRSVKFTGASEEPLVLDTCGLDFALIVHLAGCRPFGLLLTVVLNGRIQAQFHRLKPRHKFCLGFGVGQRFERHAGFWSLPKVVFDPTRVQVKLLHLPADA